MWISYSDSEVRVYHPVCERALKKALEVLDLDKKYSVIHHQMTGTLEMDFVVQNNITGKYLCVVEVKRTKTDVTSTRYQYQAMSYVQMNEGISEKPFYILTNLENAYVFRYDTRKPKVFQQMLKPGLVKIGDFNKEDKEYFFQKLTKFFILKIQEFINDDYEYIRTFDEFANKIETVKNDEKKWKSNLALMSYEYIRGAFDYINRRELQDVRLFNGNIKSICSEASRVNFSSIFKYNDNEFESSIIVDNDLLSNIYSFGYENINADAITAILHQIVSNGHEHDGEVPTDLELARFVSILAKSVSGNTNNYICDPAAGSGNLIKSAIEIYNVEPNRIKVNDINKKLLELLSLRLGLSFPFVINKDNSPIITTKNIADFDKEYFENVDVLLMNPPFVAGINCVEKKEKLFYKIKELTSYNPVTMIGQMPLEAVFLELIIDSVKKGTVISCVFPKTHLLARGVEAIAIRNMILGKFGIQKIFMYPGNEIFDDVCIDTCVLVGKVGESPESIDIISSYDNVPNIDTHRFESMLKEDFSDEFTTTMPGIVCKSVKKESLLNTVENGWRSLNSEMVESIRFAEEYVYSSEKFEKLEKYSSHMKRGQVGNSGASDLLFVDSREDFFNKINKLVQKYEIGMRNAKIDEFEINNGDSKFLSLDNISDENIRIVINEFMNLSSREGRQPRQTKSYNELKSILERENNNYFGANTILIPRAIRKSGKVYLANKKIYVSTNFVALSFDNKEDALIIASWMNTILYQLICEIESKDQEGMRKMEVNDIQETFIPIYNKDDIYNSIDIAKKNINFLDLKEPEIREIDKIWGKYLFGESYLEVLEKAKRLLKFMANRRDSD